MKLVVAAKAATLGYPVLIAVNLINNSDNSASIEVEYVDDKAASDKDAPINLITENG